MPFSSQARIWGEGSMNQSTPAFFLMWRAARAYQYHSSGQDQSTVAQWAKTTVCVVLCQVNLLLAWYIWLWHMECFCYLNVPSDSPSRGGDVTGYVWHKPTELAHYFLFCSCVYFLWPFQLYFILWILPTTLRFLTLFFRSYLCFVGPPNYTSLYEIPLQPWYNPLRLTGLKIAANWLICYQNLAVGAEVASRPLF